MKLPDNTTSSPPLAGERKLRRAPAGLQIDGLVLLSLLRPSPGLLFPSVGGVALRSGGVLVRPSAGSG